MTVLAVDVGGTKTLVGLVGAQGDVRAEREFSTRLGGDDLTTVCDGIRAALVEWGAAPARAGIGFPEYVDAHGRLTSSEVLTWSRQPADAVEEVLRERGAVRPRVRVESDVRLGALGESHFGAGRPWDSFVYISLGTGLSSALVVDGRPWAGARGEAIALGEWPSPETDATLESFASGAGIERRYRERTGRVLTGRELSAAAWDGDPVARDVLTGAGRAIGLACAQLVHLLDPAALVVGGGLGSADTPLGAALAATYAASARRPSPPPLLTAALGHRAGLLGAAALALEPIAAPGS